MVVEHTVSPRVPGLGAAADAADGQRELTLLAVGDVVPEEGRLDLVADELRAADVTFGQLEEPLSNRGEQQRYAGLGGPRWDGDTVMDQHARARMLASAGFDVMSFAGNHTMDRSVEGMLDTQKACEAAGVALVGAGTDIAAARTPRILDVDGTTIGFLAYCSVLPPGYAAGDDVPGVAPLRARTFYEQVDWQPGTRPRIVTQTYPEDLDALVADVEALRPRVDVLVVSCHWGVHFEPATIADYQREAGRAAIDAGADLVLGHHAHILKGVDVHRGKAIVYSLNNFALRPRADDGAWLTDATVPSDQQYSVMVRATIAGGRIARLALQPVVVGPDARPELVRPADPRFDTVADYLAWVGAEAELTGTFEQVDGVFVLGAYQAAAV